MPKRKTKRFLDYRKKKKKNVLFQLEKCFFFRFFFQFNKQQHHDNREEEKRRRNTKVQQIPSKSFKDEVMRREILIYNMLKSILSISIVFCITSLICI